AEDGIRDGHVTGVQTCALPIYLLGELGLPERRLIEQGESGVGGGLAAHTHAGGRQLGFLDLGSWHADHAALGELVRDLGILELRSEERRVGKECRLWCVGVWCK